MSETERAWAAGFFDGEGYFGSTIRHPERPGSGNRARGLRIQVTQTERSTLERFKKAHRGFGYLRGPYGPYKGGKTVFWTYVVPKTDQAIYAMAAMWPWLSTPKREQFKRAMAFFRKDAA